MIVSLAAFSRRALHGLGRVLRAGLPLGHGAGVRRVPGGAALARRVRAVPHRPRRVGVRGVEVVRARGRWSRWRRSTRYSRPIPSPVHNLRPARETCEQCHWPEKFHGDKVERSVRVRADESEHRDADDAPDSRGRRQRAPGDRQRHPLAHERRQRGRVHRHRRQAAGDSLGPRQGSSGNVREYTADGVNAGGRSPRRAPADGLHRLPQSAGPYVRPRRADRAVNHALARGAIPKTLPFVKREAVAALQRSVSVAGSGAEERSPADCGSFTDRSTPSYMRQPPGSRARRQWPRRQLYRRNIYPSNEYRLGHLSATTSDTWTSRAASAATTTATRQRTEKSIGQDCELCHTIQ